MEKEFGTFRKSAFGGFNRKDVIDYIEKMHNETFEYKKQVEQTVSSLNEKIFELEKAAMLIEMNASACENEIPVGSVELSGESVGDIRDATKHLKSVADELCKSLSGFIEKLTQRGLFDNNSEVKAESVFAEKEEGDKVESILSVLSFLDKESVAEEEIKENVQKEKDCVSSILDGLSFLS